MRAFHAYERVCDSALLDRLVRGRMWIGALAFALIGIVAMQLMVLKLNEGIGVTLGREATLQRENAQLGIEAATVSGEGRVEPLAAASGMTFGPPGSVHFVSSNPADVSRAAAVLAAPIQPREATVAGTGEGAEASRGERTEAPSGVSEATSSATVASTNGEAAGTRPESSGSESSGSGGHEASASEASASAPSETEASTAAPSGLGGVEAGHEAGHG